MDALDLCVFTRERRVAKSGAWRVYVCTFAPLQNENVQETPPIKQTPKISGAAQRRHRLRNFGTVLLLPPLLVQLQRCAFRYNANIESHRFKNYSRTHRNMLARCLYIFKRTAWPIDLCAVGAGIPPKTEREREFVCEARQLNARASIS